MHSVFYTSLLLFAADVIGVVIEMPLNAVAEVGQKAMFNCSTNLLYQNWILAKKREDLGTPESEKITTNCVVRPAFTAHYEVYRPAEDRNVCDLIVKDTTMQQAGIYTCMEAAPDATPGLSAILTVTDSSPAITVNNTNDLITVMENDTIVIRCVLNYNGSVPPAPTLRPCFYWTNFNGQNVSSYFDSWSTSLATSELRVKVGRQDIMPYTCHVCFELLPPTPTGYANNTPTVSNNATSPIIKILSPYSSTDESTISTATISTTTPFQEMLLRGTPDPTKPNRDQKGWSSDGCGRDAETEQGVQNGCG